VFDALTPVQLAAGAAILAVAYLVRGAAGFGSGLVAVPLLTLMLPLSIVVPLVVLLDYIAALSQGLGNRKSILWKEILPLIPFSLIGVMTALYFLSLWEALLLSKALGIFIILFALYTLSGYRPRNVVARGWVVLAGISGGMIGTLFGTPSPFYASYFNGRELEKDAFRATFATTILLDGAGRLVGYTTSGLFTPELLTLAAAALPIMGVFLFIGGHIHTRLTQAEFQRAICMLLIVSGMVLIMK